MTGGCFVLLLASILGVAQCNFIATGKEYKYDVTTIFGAGTMDHAPAVASSVYKFKSRMQFKSEKEIYGELYDVKQAQYVGPWNPRRDDPDTLNFLATDYLNVQFGLKLENGLFKQMTVPDGLSTTQTNVIKAWAAMHQINVGEIKNNGKQGFKSLEETVHGPCDVRYSVSSDGVTKSVNFDKDCKEPNRRKINEIGGYYCNQEAHKDKADGLVSTASTHFVLEKEGDAHKIAKIRSVGSVVAQMFETAGVSHVALVNITAELTSTGDNPGDINDGPVSLDTLHYEFASDQDYKWDGDRDLKVPEHPFFGNDAVSGSKDILMAGLKKQKDILHAHDHNPETVKDAHKYGIDNLLRPVSLSNYDTLKEVYDQLSGDNSEDGKMMSNIFIELLGQAGTSPAALLIKDLIKSKKFDNQRDAAKTLTGVSMHALRPSKKLVEQYEELLDLDDESFVETALPLSFATLVRKTCEFAGTRTEMKTCSDTLAAKWAQHFLKKFQESSNRNDKQLYMGALYNLRWGGLADLLKPLIYGQTDAEDEQRSLAVWAVIFELGHHKREEAFNYFFPVFAEAKNGHDLRITAASAIFTLNPSTTELANLMGILVVEKDYEVINYVYTLLEEKAKSISPCDRQIKEASGFFLKYLKQFSKYDVDYRFGVSKKYNRQFDKKKYGYGGSYEFNVVGSHRSTTPLNLGMAIRTYQHHTHVTNVIGVYLRIEGLARSLVKKFRSMDLSTWKTNDLKAIFNEMNIKEKADQPVRASIHVTLKNTIVFLRNYDESDVKGEGKVKGFMEKLKSLGNEIKLNHQRILTLGRVWVEQPTIIGLPAFYGMSSTTLMCLKADLKRGQSRGNFFGDVKYDLHLFTQSKTGLMIGNLDRKKLYLIKNDRIYHTHLPREINVGVNPLRKTLTMTISRAEHNEPTFFKMHSETSVSLKGIKSLDPKVGTEDLQQSCPECQHEFVVSNGDARSREIVNHDDTKYGYHVKAEYFDCEMDVAKKNTWYNGVAAFLPYNKNPKTPWTLFMMGLRQIRAYFFYYPRAEKCGLMARWSQSTENPVKKIEIEVTGSSDSNGERLFLRGRKTKVKVTVKAKADQPRGYRLVVSRVTSPGSLQIQTKIKYDRAAVSALGIKPYTICVNYQAKYPPFGKEMFNVDLDKPLKMTGKAEVNYGETTKCEDAEGSVSAKFEYSTTQEARETLKKKQYYKDCMEQKASPEWAGRQNLPVTRACYMTQVDASYARKYNYDVSFNKLTDRAKSIINNFRSVLKTFSMMYDDTANIVTDAEVGPFLKLDATLKDDENVADVVFETVHGTRKINDYPLRLPWSRRLRNLKFSSTYETLDKLGLLHGCTYTSQRVYTMDNVSYPISNPSCWTLMSGHCGPEPSYAVFVKKNGGKSPVAMKAYIGGHSVEIDADGNSVKVNGNDVAVSDSDEYKHEESGVEILKITKWGTTYNIYSYLRVWIMYDGNFVTVSPDPGVKGQHCGLCGNFNKNQHDEATGKDGETDVGVATMTDEWKWKC